MELYNVNVQKVMTFLVNNGYKRSSLSAYQRCYARLQKHLQRNDEGYYYSPEVGKILFESLSPALSDNIRKEYKRAIAKLNDVYETDTINLENRPKDWLSYSRLIVSFKSYLDQYLENCKEHFSESYIPSIKARCARFLVFCQDEGKQRLQDITYSMVAKFHADYRYKSAIEMSMCETVVKKFLYYLADRKLITHALSVFLYYLKTYPNERYIMMSDLNDQQRERIRLVVDESYSFPAEEFWQSSSYFINDYEKAGYSKSMRSVCRNTLSRFFLFLDMNELGYHKDIAQVWLHSIAKFRSHVWYNYRRILLLFEDFTINRKLYAQIVYRDAPNTFTLIPDWCKPELSKFLSFKVQEGKSPSTLCLYLSSCIRFCIFLNKKGITEYSQITVDTLKEFNLTDRHMTPEGKNAYNTRIRKFLAYLGDCGLLKNPVMYLALPGVYAPKEEVVITLNTDEIKEIYDYNASASSPLELRRSVMLLMGLCMGMRETDIVNLKLSDINWKNASVHFIQQKTKVELELPLLIDVLLHLRDLQHG